LLNRGNRRVQITVDGFVSNAPEFVNADKVIAINSLHAEHVVPSSFLYATDAYALPQIQLALKLIF